MTRHYRTQHETTMFRYECTTCGKHYSRKDSLKNHTRKTHNYVPLDCKLLKIDKNSRKAIEKTNPTPRPAATEGIPTFKTREARSQWGLRTEVDYILRTMTTVRKCLTPINTPTPSPQQTLPSDNYETYSSPSNHSILMDEKNSLLDQDVFVYSIYGIFN